MTSDLFASRPWIASPAPIDSSLVGMLGRYESALFYQLARSYWRGEGAIVDAGSFLGKSARCFAAGLRENTNYTGSNLTNPQARIHCFDDFRCHDEQTIGLVRDGFGDNITIGDSTRAYFDRQTRCDAELLEVHAGDFLQARWQSGPIEILMVDIAKSPALGCRVVEQLFPHLMVGRSLVVHQDYHHVWLSHIHVAMEYLESSFELVVPRADDTAAFALVAPLDPVRMQRVIDDDFSNDERLELMDRAIERLPADDRFVVRLARLKLLAELGRRADLRRDLEELRSENEQLQPRDSKALQTLTDIVELEDVVEVYRGGDFNRALANVNQVIAQGSTRPRAYALRAAILLQRDPDDAAAVAACAEVQRAAPPELQHTLLAQTQVHLGLTDAAYATVSRQLRDFGGAALHIDLCDLLVAIWRQRGLTEIDDTLLEDLARRFDQDAEVDWLRARAALLRNDPASAFAHARVGLDRAGETRRAVQLLASFQLTPAAVRAATSS